jgi:hypothetical protein
VLQVDPLNYLKGRSTEVRVGSVKKKVSLFLLLLASTAKLLFSYEHHINVKPSYVRRRQ